MSAPTSRTRGRRHAARITAPATMATLSGFARRARADARARAALMVAQVAFGLLFALFSGCIAAGSSVHLRATGGRSSPGHDRRARLDQAASP